jgi:hypothetical protein
MPSNKGSKDEQFLGQLAAALHLVGLDAIVVGNTGSILNGAPVLTNDVDLLVRDTSGNRRKLQRLARELGGAGPVAVADTTSTERIYAAVPVDILFDRIAGGLPFASVKSRASLEPVGGPHLLLVAALADIIKSKEAAGRKKDQAVLPILRDTLAVRQAAGLARVRSGVRVVMDPLAKSRR